MSLLIWLSNAINMFLQEQSSLGQPTIKGDICVKGDIYVKGPLNPTGHDCVIS